MATSSASSQHNIQKYSSGSDNEEQQQPQERNQQVVMDIRKRKRMISNRESARRSRQRKQQHLDNLTAQVNQLKTQNGQILASTTTTTQLYLNVESENSILRAQLNELSNRLQSLNDIIHCLTATATVTVTTPTTASTATAVTTPESDDQESFDQFDLELIDDGFSLNPWGFSPFGNNNCPIIMPHMDAFMC